MTDEHREAVQKRRSQKARDGGDGAPRLAAMPENAPARADTGEVPPTAPAEAAASDAAAALALAVETARKPPETSPEAEPAPEPAAAPPLAGERPPALQPAPKRAPEWRRHLPQAAAVLLAIGAGWAAGAYGPAAGSRAEHSASGWAEAATAGIRQSHDDIIRVTGDVKALKVTVDALKEAVDKGKPDAGMRQVLERLDRSERLAQDAVARLARVAEHVERTQGEPARAAAVVAERLDRLERQVVATANTVATVNAGAHTVASPAASATAEPAQTASLPKFDPRQTPAEGWALLEVYDGAALISNRNKEIEVAPGEKVTGLGKILAIEKRGKTWVVVSEKGYIGIQRR